MDELLEELLSKIKDYMKNEDNIALIKKAYYKAYELHKGQYRKGGNMVPYIIHPVGVAIILASLNAGPQTLAAALLHDTIEDTNYTKEEIEKEFGSDIASLVDGVTKIGRLKFKTDLSQAEYHRKMLLATATDIRVVLIKIADRLHNIRTLSELPKERQKAIANETLEIYAPLAHRLGLFQIKAELEDTSLKYNDPEMYYRVSGLIQMQKSEREKGIIKIIDEIKELLKKYNVIAYSIKGRIKNINSIYKKMVFKKQDFEDIYDLLAIRVIVKDIETCYKVLGIIHANYTPIPKRFKDYIAMPKPNLYQSLHTTVISKDSQLFEVQIRTEEMDQVAEMGIAAHWAYKESRTYSKDKEQFEMAQKMKWYSDLLKMSTDENEAKKDPISFVEDIKSDILLANVYVFTPDGKVIELPQGSTPIDFAYKIHTDVGNKMIGCNINNKIATIDTILKTGDIVSIKTGNKSGPSADWLKICKSSYSKNKIKNFLNKQNHDILLEDGKNTLEKELLKNQITQTLDDKFALDNFSKQGVSSLEGLYLEIGKGNISEKTVVSKIIQNKPLGKDEWLEKQIEKAKKIDNLKKTTDSTIIVPGLNKPKLKLANCCLPVYGDVIKGYISKTGGIVVHRDDCNNYKDLEKERVAEVFWNDFKKEGKKYQARLSVNVESSSKALTLIINLLSISKISLAEIKARNTKSLGGIINLKLLVKDLSELNQVIANIKKIPSIYDVKREII